MTAKTFAGNPTRNGDAENPDTCQNISSSRFIQKTENLGPGLVPNAKSVLCKEHACTVENDASDAVFLHAIPLKMVMHFVMKLEKSLA